MIDLTSDLDVAPTIGVAVHSVLQLTEAAIGRPLETECCCSRELSTDEQAVLAMVAAVGGPASRFGSEAIPHGIPGALHWAIASLEAAMGMDDCAVKAAPAACPFAA